MKIVKEYPSGAKHVQYEHTDFNYIKKQFGSSISDTVIERLCDHLNENNMVIDAIDCYDYQSGWSGTNFKIGKADLSFNGYCLIESSVLQYLNGEQNPMWYHTYDEEYKIASEWVSKNK